MSQDKNQEVMYFAIKSKYIQPDRLNLDLKDIRSDIKSPTLSDFFKIHKCHSKHSEQAFYNR